LVELEVLVQLCPEQKEKRKKKRGRIDTIISDLELLVSIYEGKICYTFGG
jgi:hypothetical protein